MKRRQLLAGLLAVLLLVSCSPQTGAPSETDGDHAEVADHPLAAMNTELIFPAFEPTVVQPAVPEYAVEAGLGNIANLDRYVNEYWQFSAEQEQALVEQGFFVDGGMVNTQPFSLYEGNEYSYRPNFVTADSVLHLFHICYDALLRDLEVQEFLPRLQELSQAMVTASVKDYEEAKDAVVKDAALRNTAYFAVATELFDAPYEGELPLEALGLMDEELAMIQSETMGESSLVGKQVDYSQFKPRGHYTRSPELEMYFRGSMLYSQLGLFFYDDEGQPQTENAVQALLMAKNLCDDEASFRLWEDVNDPLVFLVENADDVDPYVLGQVYASCFSDESAVDALNQEAALKEVYAYLDKLPQPSIQYYEGLSFRFLPQRAVLDNVLAQMVVDVSSPSRRPLYSGVDVMGILGNPVADRMVQANEANEAWPEFAAQYEKAKEMARVLDGDPTNRQNVYRNWLWILQAYSDPIEEGMPAFMQSEAWGVKDLNSALGSWAQLKHDTILYGKQVGAEMGGGEELERPKSYVEPRLPVYERLLWTLDFMTENLKVRGLLSEGHEKNLENFGELVRFLRDVSVTELRGDAVSDEAQDRLFYIGGEMENIFVKFYDENAESFYEIEEQADRNMATIADLMMTPENTVGIAPGQYLEVGSGMAQDMYVVYPVDGELVLGVGPVYAYYEFLSSQRLTDEEFQGMIFNTWYNYDDPEAATVAQPEWTEIYRQDTVFEGY